MKTVEAAVGRWHGILMNLGMDEYQLRGKHCPCPICGGKDRFRWDNRDGRGTFFCTGCGAGDGLKLAGMLTGLEFKELAAKIDGMLGNIEVKQPKPKNDPAKRLRAIQAELQSADGVNPVRRYLRSRGLTLPPLGIQYHPAMSYYDDGFKGKHPAMVATYRNSQGKPITYHVTYLTPDGKKADVSSVRKILPPTETLPGGAIALCQPAEVMGIAEGIETALAASVLYRMPVWACATAGNLEQWQPPAIAKHIHIFGDNDSSFTGQKSAYVLANRLALAGLKATVLIPEAVGDWNDVITQGAA